MGLEKFLPYISDPNICYILLVVGFYSVLFELTHPGFILFGLMGIVVLVVDYFAMQNLGVSLPSLGLIVAGIVLFIVEAFIPRFGIIAVLGVATMIAGSSTLFPTQALTPKVSYYLIFPLVITTAVITIFLVRVSIRAHRAKVLGGKEGLVGLKGEAHTNLIPGKKGTVSAQGTLWNAIADEEIKKGEDVEVVSVDGMKLKVKKSV